MADTKSQRIIRALNQLQQFLPAHAHESGAAVNVITGVSVRPIPDENEDDHGLVAISFQGSNPIQVDGESYLELQMIEDGRYIVDGKDGKTPVARHVHFLAEHFQFKYGLD